MNLVEELNSRGTSCADEAVSCFGRKKGKINWKMVNKDCKSCNQKVIYSAKKIEMGFNLVKIRSP